MYKENTEILHTNYDFEKHYSGLKTKHVIGRSIIYFVDPKRLAEKVLWLHKDRTNCFSDMPRSEAINRWDMLKEYIQRAGFNHRCPIYIVNKENRIIDGNHRFGISLELDLNYIPVEFRWGEQI